MATTKKRPLMYLLINGKIKPVFDIAKVTWVEKQKSERDRTVAQTDMAGLRVSTVFLGVDHNHSGKGAPVLFETMIFGGAHDGYQTRYCTLDEARAGHEKAVELAWRALPWHRKFWEYWRNAR